MTDVSRNPLSRFGLFPALWGGAVLAGLWWACWPASAAKPQAVTLAAAPAKQEPAAPKIRPRNAGGKGGSGNATQPTSPLPTQKSERSSTGSAAPHRSLQKPDPLVIAKQVDALILAELQQKKLPVASRCSDEDYLRRVSFDLAGVSPSPEEVTLFGLDPHPHKRAQAVARLLQTPAHAENWARYWKDVVFLRATEARAGIAERSFQEWLKSQFSSNQSWDAITTALITATGDVQEAGQTALIYSHSADPDEVAAETSRIFLGIQIQCANCHDHPNDRWKREQFHQLAAFFPRTRVAPKRLGGERRSFEISSLVVNTSPAGRRGGRAGTEMTQMFSSPEEFFANPERFIKALDTDGDSKISKEEASRGPGRGQLFNRLLSMGDTDKDGKLSLEEIKKIPPPDNNLRRGSPEHYMPDLKDPRSKGILVNPKFFIGDLQPAQGLSDLDRRNTLAKYITSPANSWFAKAIINRLWGALCGEGFYMPIDDIGPDRHASYPAALDALSTGFIASGYDLHWLFTVITATDVYQRRMHRKDPAQTTLAFAAAAPTRLRADHLFDSLIRVLGIQEPEPVARTNAQGMPPRNDNSPRGQFHTLFNFDPSTLPDDVLGTIPQALFLMNTAVVNNLIKASDSRTSLSRILQKYRNDRVALQELYLLVHAREPSATEMQICLDYIRQINRREEAFEDIFWSLLNSTEFQTKR